VTAAVPSIQTPLASAAVLAEATNGDAVEFRGLMNPIVKAGRPFTSVSLWSARAGTAAPLVVVGGQPALATESQSQIKAVFRRAVGSPTVTINNMLNRSERRLGYALTVPGRDARYVVYGEAILPKERRARIEKDSAFADLGYALYLSRTVDTRYLLASSTGGALLHGRRASVAVPFGDSQLLVEMTPLTDLGGTLLARLWWILGAFGLLLTLGAAMLVERLTRRRMDAEGLAIENARLYAEQRSVAQTLQHSLLAEAFPEIEGLEFAARYVAGVEGIDIGGDWYDVVRLDSGNILIVVGDVSGRGLEAATMMASLRYAARAYAVEGHSPALILTKLAALVSVARDEHFATVLCGLLNVADGRVTVANAGHPGAVARVVGSRRAHLDRHRRAGRRRHAIAVRGGVVLVPARLDAAPLHRRCDRAPRRAPRRGLATAQGCERAIVGNARRVPRQAVAWGYQRERRRRHRAAGGPLARAGVGIRRWHTPTQESAAEAGGSMSAAKTGSNTRVQAASNRSSSRSRMRRSVAHSMRRK
jgi:hypothetical protein